MKRWATEIVAQDVIFLDSKGQGQKSDQPPAPPEEKGEVSGQAGGYDASEENKSDEEFGGMGQDVPF